jgi:hypothetical protein
MTYVSAEAELATRSLMLRGMCVKSFFQRFSASLVQAHCHKSESVKNWSRHQAAHASPLKSLLIWWISIRLNPVGLEQGEKSSGNRHFSLYTSAKSDALSAKPKNEAIFAALATDPELTEIAAMWANLSPTVCHCVMILVRSR